MNRLVELPPIAQFAPELRELKAPHNFLTAVPAGIPATLRILDISHNILKSLGDELGHLPQLENLDISFNRLRALPNLPSSLLHFNAEQNLLSESVPLSLSLLNTLQLNGNQFTTIPELICSRASVLLMRSNRLQGIAAGNISRATKRIDLTNNEIKEIPLELCELTGIQYLNISVNRLTSLPQEIVALRLTALFISENDISNLPPLPKTLTSLTCVKCKFTELPAVIFDVPRLGYVDFSSNRITGLARLPMSQTILLSLNEIEQLPEMPDIVSRLDISGNRITELSLTGEMNSIQDLDVSQNRLRRFTFPVLPLMATLRIADNPLSMRLEFSSIPAIRVLDIANTEIKVVGSLPAHLKELSCSDPYFFKGVNSPCVRLYSVTGGRVGYSETIGPRPSMEDALILRRKLAPGVDIYAVIDGHGGVATAINSAFLIPAHFAQLRLKAIGNITSVLKKVNTELSELQVRDGAAIVFTVVRPAEIGCAHLGDSRALILKRDFSVVALTVDHKPTERSEIDLVKELRSFVDANRTAGVLSVSRAIADFGIPGVGRVPDMTQYTRQQDDFRLVLGCDGVFDVIENNEVGEILRDEPAPGRAAILLRNIALARGSQDNISVIVVDISMPEKV
jgi:Leucine-rich repeat (LRR) protein/serine/threonine protein phosphatase PrpC